MGKNERKKRNVLRVGMLKAQVRLERRRGSGGRGERGSADLSGMYRGRRRERGLIRDAEGGRRGLWVRVHNQIIQTERGGDWRGRRRKE